MYYYVLYVFVNYIMIDIYLFIYLFFRCKHSYNREVAL